MEVIHKEAATADQLATTATTEDTPTPEQIASTAEGVVTTATTKDVVTTATTEDLVTITTTEGARTTVTDLYAEFLTATSTIKSGKFAFYLYNKVLFQLYVYPKHKMQCKYYPVIHNSIKWLVSYIVKELWRKLFWF